MKKISKSIMLSALAALAFGSVAVTTTYALFTSKEEATVEVTTGKVSVSAKIDAVTLYSPTLIATDGTITDETNAANETTFACGGTVAYEENQITVDKMAPGDKITASFTVKNDSTIAIKYRAKVELPDGTELNASVTGLKDKWTKAEAGAELSSDAVTLVVELPTTATEGFEESKTVKLIVEAVQANADVSDSVVADGTQAGLVKLIDELPAAEEEGQYTIELPEGSYEVPSSSDAKTEGKEIVIKGTGEGTALKVTSSTVVAEGGNLIYDRNSSFVFDNMSIIGEGKDKNYGGIVCDKVTYKNCVIYGKTHLYGSADFINCTFIQEEDEYSFYTWGADVVNVENCRFNSQCKAIKLYGDNKTTLNIKNSTFTSKEEDKAVVEVGREAGYTSSDYTLNITDCTQSGFAIGQISKETSSPSNTGSAWYSDAYLNRNESVPMVVTIDGVEVYRTPKA